MHELFVDATEDTTYISYYRVHYRNVRYYKVIGLGVTFDI